MKDSKRETIGARAFFPVVIGTRDEQKNVIFTNVAVGGVTVYQYLAMECLTALLSNPNHAPGPETRMCAHEQARRFLDELDREAGSGETLRKPNSFIRC